MAHKGLKIGRCVLVWSAAFLSSAAGSFLPQPPGRLAAGRTGPVKADAVDPLLDCGLRQLAYDFASTLQSWRGSFQDVFDALQLGAECNATTPTYRPAAPPTSGLPAGRALFFVDAAQGIVEGDCSSVAPCASLEEGLRAARAAGPSTAAVIVRNGTYYLAVPLLLTAYDNGLIITAEPGHFPVISGGTLLEGNASSPLHWSLFNATGPSLAGPFNSVSGINSCVDEPGESGPTCAFAGLTPDAAACAAACLANTSSCVNAYTWHDNSTGGWAQMCYFRTDGVWAPVSEGGHVSGYRLPGKNVWSTQLPPAAASLVGSGFDGLLVNGRRAVRGRYPNGNPEDASGMSPAGYTDAAAWLPPRPPAAPPTVVQVQSPQRTDDYFFPQYQLGIGGTVAAFSPPESFWGTPSPPAGDQYRVPSGLVAPADLAARLAEWPTGAVDPAHPPIVHAFHSGYWGGWSFQVANVSHNATNDAWSVEFGAGGWQEARGSSTGGGFYLENALAEVDAPGEWFYDAHSTTLYYNFNASDTPSGPNGASDLSFVATRLENLLTVSGTQDTPVTGVQLIGLAFTATAPTFMKPFRVPSGGDWSFCPQAAVVLTGTAGASIVNCTFNTVGGNAVLLSAFNDATTISGSSFAWAGESAIVTAGETDGIDASALRVPQNTVITGNAFRDLGIFVVQAGAWYSALTINASFTRNVAFNLPRAAVNINDGMGGGHVIAENVLFNTVRTTSDHGPINSWDRQPLMVPGVPDLRNALITVGPRNLLFCNYHAVWTHDTDDGSNNQLCFGNVHVWSGSKNYLGFNKTATDNLYIYPGANGASPHCAMSQGQHAWGPELMDTWAGNTCIVQSGATELYSFGQCTPGNATSGLTPRLLGNTLLAADGAYGLQCGGTTFSSLAAAQDAGFDVGSKVGVAPSTADALAMARSVLQL